MDSSQVLLLDAHPVDTDALLKTQHTDMVHKHELSCPRHMMGVVIGKGGRTIRELMESSGCHVVLHQECQKVVITAPSQEQLLECSARVQALLGSGGAECSAQFLCPLNRAGTLIGKQGGTVRELMRQSGTVIKTSRADVTPDGCSQVFHITAVKEEALTTVLQLMQGMVDKR